MSVNEDNVKKIARLSKISLSDNEVEKYLTDLNQIIGWVDQLKEVDTEKVSPTFSSFGAGEGIKQRDDIVSDGGYRKEIISNAPKSEEGFFLVPKVID
tara:strand:- start:1555 stop:1848 length:294 start_codon:yes stop_codon:yes gene_type:complete